MNRDRDEQRRQQTRDEQWERDDRRPGDRSLGAGRSLAQGGVRRDDGEPRVAREGYDRDREVYRAQGYESGQDNYRGTRFDRDRDYDRDRWTHGARGSFERDYQVELERGFERGGPDPSQLGRYTGSGPSFDEGGDMTYEGSSYRSSYGRGSNYGHRDERARYTGQGHVSRAGSAGDLGWGGASREGYTEGREGLWGVGFAGDDAYFGQGGDVGYRDGGAGSRYGRQSQGAQAGSGQGQRQSFRGKGPKNYKRSDERIRDEVCECLSDDHEVDASEVDVSVSDGVVTVSGTVSNRYEKRRIEDLVERLSGVTDVNNQVRVQRGASARDHGGSSGNSEKGPKSESSATASRSEATGNAKASNRSS